VTLDGRILDNLTYASGRVFLKTTDVRSLSFCNVRLLPLRAALVAGCWKKSIARHAVVDGPPPSTGSEAEIVGSLQTEEWRAFIAFFSVSFDWSLKQDKQQKDQ